MYVAKPFDEKLLILLEKTNNDEMPKSNVKIFHKDKDESQYFSNPVNKVLRNINIIIKLLFKNGKEHQALVAASGQQIAPYVGGNNLLNGVLMTPISSEQQKEQFMSPVQKKQINQNEIQKANHNPNV